jgi:acyl-coenzyme A synthetase/AMP-(fatty) acid ligase
MAVGRDLAALTRMPRRASRSYTYARVEMQSNRVANYLLAQGIRRGDVVSIFAHRSAAIVYAIMGVLKAGATFSVIGMCTRIVRTESICVSE